MSLKQDPAVPPIFGELNNSIQNLTARMQSLLDRNPSKEFDQTEGNLGADYQAKTFSKLENFYDPLTSASTIFNREYTATIYPKAFRLALIAAVNNTTINPPTPFGLLVEFFKKQNGIGFSGIPSFSKLLYPTYTPYSNVMNVANGAFTTSVIIAWDELIPVNCRYARVSLCSLYTGAKISTALGSNFSAANSVTGIQTTFFGD